MRTSLYMLEVSYLRYLLNLTYRRFSLAKDQFWFICNKKQKMFTLQLVTNRDIATNFKALWFEKICNNLFKKIIKKVCHLL